MKIITSKSELKPVVDNALGVYNMHSKNAFVTVVHSEILKKKIKFPILEYTAKNLHTCLA